jgi:hypothetical protein
LDNQVFVDGARLYLAAGGQREDRGDKKENWVGRHRGLLRRLVSIAPLSERAA